MFKKTHRRVRQSTQYFTQNASKSYLNRPESPQNEPNSVPNRIWVPSWCPLPPQSPDFKNWPGILGHFGAPKGHQNLRTNDGKICFISRCWLMPDFNGFWPILGTKLQFFRVKINPICFKIKTFVRNHVFPKCAEKHGGYCQKQGLL